MKKSLMTVTLCAVCIWSQAATWTFHNFRDNYLEIGIAGGTYQVSEVGRDVIWDFGYDMAFPEDQFSGLYDFENSPWTPIQIGYQDDWTVTLDGPYAALIWSWLMGGYPQYGGGIDFTYPPPNYDHIVYDPGEYWIDFDSSSTSELQVARVSTVKPSDFGKWAWDGSVNPSWVEPLAKKGHGKGHK